MLHNLIYTHSLRGGSGNDLVSGGGNRDWDLYGDEGDDTILSGTGSVERYSFQA